jgi:hypothetical protein
MNRTGLSGNRGVLLLVMAGVAAVGGLLWTVWGWNPRATLSGTNFYFWFLLCMCGELLRNSSSGKATTTMAACAHIASLLVLRRPEAMAVVGIASVVAGRLVHRRAWAQSAFEAGALMCVVGLARIVFDVLSPDGWQPSSLVAAGHYVPALAAAAVYFVGGFAARFGWTVVEEGDVSSAVRAHNGPGFEFLSAGALLSLGMLLAIQFKMAGAIGAMIVAIPVVVARHGLDSFAQGGGRQSSYQERPRAAA